MARFDRRIQGFAFILLLSIGAPLRSQTDPQLNAKLESTMESVRSGGSVKARMEAAQQLTNLTRKSRAGSVSDTTVAHLIALMDDPEDGVRLFVAGALGNLKAKAAIPKLLALLPAADCLEGTVTSARSIRFALERMGVELPPQPSYNDCHKPKSEGPHS